jgi:hypothetical protein
MKTYQTIDTFDISGRGKVYTTMSPAGEELPIPGEQVILDGVTVEVLGIERHALPMDSLTRNKTPIGLMIRPIPS